jgi:hypothetical protein
LLLLFQGLWCIIRLFTWGLWFLNVRTHKCKLPVRTTFSLSHIIKFSFNSRKFLISLMFIISFHFSGLSYSIFFLQFFKCKVMLFTWDHSFLCSSRFPSEYWFCHIPPIFFQYVSFSFILKNFVIFPVIPLWPTGYLNVLLDFHAFPCLWIFLLRYWYLALFHCV